MAEPGEVETTSRFDRLGMLVSQHTSGELAQTYSYDKAGNLVFRQDGSVQHYYRIAPESNRLFVDSIPGQTSNEVLFFGYTASGSRLREFNANAATGGDDEKRFYYDGLGRATGIRDFDHDGPGRSTCIQYDADGQMAQPCDDNPSWLTFDGPNVAGTMGLRWVFVSGPGVDDPLMGLFRSPTEGAKEFYWVTDGAGRQLGAGLANGSLGGTDRNDYLFDGGKFAGGSQNSNSFGSSRFESPIAPGFSAYRNRIYDQKTGRWTQEDPIGLAGGLNLYQFNGNNPVVYRDPFGLCPPCRPDQEFIRAVAGRVQPLENIVNTVGNVTGLNALGEAAEMITNGQVGAGLFLLATTLFENSPEGQGGRIIFSGKKVTSAVAEALGIARRDLGKRIEKIKKAAGLGGADNVNIDEFGNVTSKKTDEIIGNVHDELKEK